MRKYLLILFLAITAFGLSQNLKVPEVSLNSVILPAGGELEFNASNLNDGQYNLIFSGPNGQSILEELETTNGTLNHKLVLNDSGNWKVALSGQGLDLQMNVAVMPAVVSDTENVDNASVEKTEALAKPEVAQTEANTNSEAAETEAKVETNNSEIKTETHALNTEVKSNEEPLETANTSETTDAETGMAVTEEIKAPEVENKLTTDTKDANAVANEAENVVTVVTEIAKPDAPEEKLSTKTKEAVSQAVAVGDETEQGKATDVTANAQTEQATEAIEQSNKADEASAETTGEVVSEEKPVEEKPEVIEETTTEAEAEQVLHVNAQADKFSLLGSSLQGKAGSELVWKLDFPDSSGQTAKTVVEAANGVYIGHGNSLLLVDKTKGSILSRWILSGQIDSLQETPMGLDINVKVGKGLTEKFSLSGGQLDKAAHFDTNPELFRWLENEANVSNPAERLTQDPTNPWLYLKAGQANSNLTESKSLYSSAIEAGNSFYDLAGLSRKLLELGENGLSTKAFSKALKDFAARGYDTRALTDMKLHENFNFPLNALNASVDKGDLVSSKVLAEQLKYFVSPGSPEVRKALVSYSSLLKRNGEKDAAKEWLTIAKSANRSSVVNILDRVFASLGGIAWYAALSTLLAGLFLRLVLLFKYWRPQSLMLKRKQDSGKKVSPIARIFAVRYYSFTEKLVLNLLLFTTLMLVALATWNSKVSNLPDAVGSGSFANASVQNFVGNSELSGTQGSFIKGFMAQINNKKSEAEENYKAAGNYPAALNNLAALSGDKTLFEEALKYAKNLPEALYNSGKEPDLMPFQKEYLGGPALALPTKEDFQSALSGSWQDAITRVFTKPLDFLKELSAANPFKLRGKLLNSMLEYFILALFLLYALWTIFWLFIPRPRLARNAPRSFIYQILAFLVPGSGLADEMWGILLLVPWAIVGIDAISRFFGWGVTLSGLSLRWDIYILAAIYIINLIAIVIEFLSYRQRMIKLKSDDVDLAREFNLIS